MALIPCPDCGTEVSDLAAACPKCARPIASSAPPALHQGGMSISGTITTEATGKDWKALQLGGGVGILIGIGTCAAGHPGVAFVLFFLAAPAFLTGAIGGWWNHG